MPVVDNFEKQASIMRHAQYFYVRIRSKFGSALIQKLGSRSGRHQNVANPQHPLQIMQNWERKKLDRDEEQTVPGLIPGGIILNFFSTSKVLHADIEPYR